MALHLEMLGYILGLLKGFKYLRKTGDLIGDNLTLRLLRRTLVLDAPCKSTEDAENKFRGLILTVVINFENYEQKWESLQKTQHVT